MYLNPAVMQIILCMHIILSGFAYQVCVCQKVIQPFVTDKGVQPRLLIMNVNSYASKPIFRHLNVTAVFWKWGTHGGSIAVVGFVRPGV